MNNYKIEKVKMEKDRSTNEIFPNFHNCTRKTFYIDENNEQTTQEKAVKGIETFYDKDGKRIAEKFLAFEKKKEHPVK